jgi:4-amino-4-deoxy-L-arabinose transferase-like glycosyltransferase
MAIKGIPLLDWELISRKLGATETVLRVRQAQRFISEYGFYIGLGSVWFAVALYNGIFFNKYFPITEGWFSAYAHLIRQGLIPYRDFYLFLTPLYPLQLAAFQAVFGESYIALRILGIVVVLLLSFFLYLILVRRFSPLVSVIATVTAIIYYQSGVAHITYDFIQFFTLFVLAATYLIIKYSDKESIDRIDANQNAAALLFAAGILVSLAFLTKQSNGTLVVVFSTMAVAFATTGQDLPYRLRNILIYMLGMALPVLITGFWLYFVSALSPFINQVIFGAIEAKGSLWSILFSWIERLANKEYLSQLKTALLYMLPLFALSLIGTAFTKYKVRDANSQTGSVWAIFPFLALFGATIVLAYNGGAVSMPWMVAPGFKLAQSIVAVSTALAIAWMMFSLLQPLVGHSICRKDLDVSATMTLGLMFGNGTSAGIGEVSAFLGFALTLAFLLTLPNTYGIAKVVVGAVCLSFLLLLVNAKLTQPYAWWYLSVPDIRESTTRPALPLLAGFRLPPSSTYVLEETTRIIQTHSRPDDDVFAFPNIPGFYVLADRWPHSRVVVSWFDFLPDRFARAEANRLRATPPTIIVDLKLPDEAWLAHEKLFRGGKPLGQRDIQAAIIELTEQRKLYQLDLSSEVSLGCVLEVWHKKMP